MTSQVPRAESLAFNLDSWLWGVESPYPHHQPDSGR